MKKFLSFVSLAIICLSFFGCRSNSREINNGNQPEQRSEVSEDQAQDVLEGEGNIGKYYVKIKAVEMAKDYNNSDAVIITYEWMNNHEESKSFWPGLQAKVFQDGIECETPIMKINGIGSDGLMTEIKPGKTFEFKVGYTLNNSYPEIEVEITESFSFSSNPQVVSKMFELPL